MPSRYASQPLLPQRPSSCRVSGFSGSSHDSANATKATPAATRKTTDSASVYTAAAGTPAAVAQAEAAGHGYTTAFWWAAGILVAGAIATRLLFEG